MQLAATFAPKNELEAIQALIKDEFHAVNRLIQQKLSSDVVLINQLGHYIIGAGGKRLRPILVLLSAGIFGYRGTQHINLAAVIEFIHTATLLHDDVVDDSAMRRGRETANNLWGGAASVLVGDFLYSRAFQMMVESGNMRVMQILADATNVIAEGEVMQLLNCHDPDTSKERYLEVIRCKTAKLFEAAAQLGAVVSNGSDAEETALRTYGKHLGTAFQIIDDALDYSADSEETGKNIGDDLNEGKPTLPLIYAMRAGNPEQVQIIRAAIEKGGKEYIVPVMKAIESTGAIAYTIASAKQEAEIALQSLSALPDTPYTQALASLARFAVNRSY
jgi:octaprenyl-diphosphate synthase